MNGLIILWNVPEIWITWTLTSKKGWPPSFSIAFNKRHTGSPEPMRFLQFNYLSLFVSFLETIQILEVEPIYIYIYILIEIRTIFPSCSHVTKDDIYFADAGICWRLGLAILGVFFHRLLKPIKYRLNKINPKENAGAWRPTVARWRGPDVIFFLYQSIVFCLGLTYLTLCPLILLAFYP